MCTLHVVMKNCRQKYYFTFKFLTSLLHAERNVIFDFCRTETKHFTFYSGKIEMTFIFWKLFFICIYFRNRFKFFLPKVFLHSLIKCWEKMSYISSIRKCRLKTEFNKKKNIVNQNGTRNGTGILITEY